VVARDFTGAGLRDESGHATHVSSTIAGTGAASAGRERGVAPGATIYSAKACTRMATGIGCPDDAIIAAMTWLAAEQHVRVVNMSLGGPNEADQDAVEEAVERLTAEYGTLFVIAAGNSGIDRPVSSPASAASALAVGAVNADDTLADYSSVGPRLERGVLKPEITAPGTEILAAKAYGRGADAYQRMSGTSMATPHVAGAAAILAQQHPEWTPADLKAALMASAAPTPDVSVYSQGAGRLDVARAITQSVTTVPASVNVDDNEPTGKGGKVDPHGHVPQRRSAARHPAPAARGRAPRDAADGGAAGMFALSRRTVTVPAGGTATVTVKIDAGTARRAGLYGGELTATGAGGVEVRTPVGLDRQPQHTLTINHINRAGQATNRARVVIAGLDNEFLGYATELRTGTVAATLPAGRYLVSSTIMDLGTTRMVTALTDPSLTLDRDRTLDMDARLGKPMSVTLQRPGAEMKSAFVNIYARVARGGALGLGIGGISLAEVFSARLGTASARHVDTKVSGYWSGDGGAWTAAVALNEPHRVLDGYTRVVRNKEFATVRNSFAAAATAKSTITKINIPIWPDFGGDDYAGAIETPLPATRTDYYASSGGVTWQVDAYHNVAGASDSLPTVPYYVNHFRQDAREPSGRGGPTTSPGTRASSGRRSPLRRRARPGSPGPATPFLSPVLYSDAQGRAAAVRPSACSCGSPATGRPSTRARGRVPTRRAGRRSHVPVLHEHRPQAAGRPLHAEPGLVDVPLGQHVRADTAAGLRAPLPPGTGRPEPGRDRHHPVRGAAPAGRRAGAGHVRRGAGVLRRRPDVDSRPRWTWPPVSRRWSGRRGCPRDTSRCSRRSCSATGAWSSRRSSGRTRFG
jgi:hypothetical protein